MTDSSVGPRRASRRAPLAITRRRVGVRALIMLAALAIPGVSLHAQRIALSVGDSTRVTVAPGAKLAVPIGVDLAAAGGATLASLQAGLTWGITRLTFDSLRVAAASGFSLTPNLAGASSGSLTFNAFGASALPASGPIATAYFTATATTGGTSVVLTPATAGSELGASVLSALNVRNLGVCVAPSGKWGDVNDDGTVNIIDAQQIARSSVGLSVANAAAVSGRGDVTADGTVNIIDAQQIARASVALSAAARVNSLLFTPPVVNSVTLTPGSATSVVTGGAVALAAVPRDSAGVDLGGCAPVTWSSSNPSVATVSSGGVVVAVTTGSATITATSGTRSATVPITVSPPYVLALTAAPAGGTSNTFLSTQPKVAVQTLAGAVVSAEVRQITATLASGSGSLSGTTTVSTVNGVATFTDLAITGTGTHTLAFTTAGASAVTSGSVTMVAPTSMRLLVAATPSLAGTAGTDVVIPVLLDLSGRGSQDLAAITATLTWDPAKYTYIGNGAGTWVDASGGAASVTVNATNTASGTLSLTGFTTDATTASATLRTVTLRPVTTGPVTLSAVVSTAGNVSGQSVVVTPRNLGGLGIPATISFSRDSLLLDQWADTGTVTVTVRDVNANIVAVTASSWTIADAAVASISNGLVSSARSGRTLAQVTVTAGAFPSLQASIPVRVLNQRNLSCTPPSPLARGAASPVATYGAVEILNNISVSAWAGSRSIAFDFDDDGDYDVVRFEYSFPFSAVYSGAIRVFKNDGGVLRDSTAVYAPVGLIPDHPRDFEVADFDGDGRDELLLIQHGYDAAPFPGAPNILLRSTGGRLVNVVASRFAELSASAFSHGSSVADIDCDGDLDILELNLMPAVGNRLWINAGGSFSNGTARAPLLAGTTGQRWQETTFIDFDSDGDPDIYLGARSGDGWNEDIILVNDGYGNFRRSAAVQVPAPRFAAAHGVNNAKSADFNGDGRMDLLFFEIPQPFSTSSAIRLWLNTGNGSFTDASTAWGLPTACGAEVIEPLYVRDMNGDGWPDVIIPSGCPELGGSGILTNTGSGFSMKAFSTFVSWLGNDVVTPVDLNGDGRLHLFFGERGGNPVMVRRP